MRVSPWPRYHALFASTPSPSTVASTRLAKNRYATESGTVIQPKEIKWSGVDPRQRPEDRSKPWTKASKLWRTEIARIAARYEDSNATSVDRPHASNDTGLFEEEEEIEISPVLAEHSSIDAWKDVWRNSDDWARAAQWPDQALFYLRDESPRTLEFLLVTLIEPLPDPHKLADVLDVIACYMARERDSAARQTLMRKLYQSVCLVLRKYDVSFPLSQRTMRLLSLHIHNRALLRLVAALKRWDVSLEAGTLDAARLLEAAVSYSHDSKYTAQVLPSLAVVAADNVAGDKHDLATRKLSLQLLKLVKAGDVAQRGAIFTALKDMGMNLDRYHLNVLLSQYSNEGEYDRAWQVYERMKRRRVRPDSATYTILGRLCRRTSDFDAFRNLYQAMHDRHMHDPSAALDDRALVEMLYCFWAFAGHLRARSFERPLSLYLQHYEIQPLMDLGLIHDEEPRVAHASQYRATLAPSARRPCGPPRLPSSSVLATMIHMWVRSQQSVLPVRDAFHRFKRRLEAHDPLIVPLASKRFVWHSFLYAFNQKEALDLWPHVIASMQYPFDAPAPLSALPASLRGLAADALAAGRLAVARRVPVRAPPTDRETGRPAYVVKPSRQTWNCVMNTLKLHGAAPAAAAVLAHLQASAAPPDLVSWNTLVAAHARAGDERQAVRALERMEAAGLEWDAFTRRAVLGARAHVAGVQRPGLGARVRGGGLKTSLRRRPDGSLVLDDE